MRLGFFTTGGKKSDIMIDLPDQKPVQTIRSRMFPLVATVPASVSNRVTTRLWSKTLLLPDLRSGQLQTPRRDNNVGGSVQLFHKITFPLSLQLYFQRFCFFVLRDVCKITVISSAEQ